MYPECACTNVQFFLVLSSFYEQIISDFQRILGEKRFSALKDNVMIFMAAVEDVLHLSPTEVLMFLLYLCAPGTCFG